VGEEITIKFPVPGNVPKWTLYPLPKLVLRGRLLLMSHLMLVKLLQTETSQLSLLPQGEPQRQEARLLNISDDRAAIMVHSSEGWSVQLGN